MRTATFLLLVLGLTGCETTKSASPDTSDPPAADISSDDTGEIPVELDCAAGEIAQDGSCLSCGPGTYSPGGDASICSPCEPGTTDLDADPATECDACTEPEGDVYVVNVCMPNQDTSFADCTFPEEGERVLERCAKGSFDERGSDTEFADCSNPEEGQFVTIPCDAGEPNDRGSNTEFEDCTAAAEGQWISEACVPGDYTAAGTDSVLADCTEPGEGEYVAEACAGGMDTVIEACDSPEEGEYLTADCIAGDALTAGSNTGIETCTEPEGAQYVVTACGADTDTVVATCTEPDATAGTYTLSVCEPGDSSTAGSDTVIEECTPAETGELPAASECTTGSSTVAGADRVPGGAAELCLDTSGNPASIGVDAEFFFAVAEDDAWSTQLILSEGSTYCATVEGLGAGTHEYFFAADESASPTGEYAHSSEVLFEVEITENETSEECNRWDLAGCGPFDVAFTVDLSCSGVAVALGHSVVIMSSANDWDEPWAVLSHDGDGVWTGSAESEAGTFEWKIATASYIESTEEWVPWVSDEALDGLSECAAPGEEFYWNRSITIEADTFVESALGRCTSCP